MDHIGISLETPFPRRGLPRYRSESFGRLAFCALSGLALLAAGPRPALGLDPGKRLTQYPRRSWSTEHGLPQRRVGAIVQTQDGYLWIGTNAGLARFDGVRFRVFDNANTPALPNRPIWQLHAGRDGALWIGTFGGGVIRLRDGRFETVGGEALATVVVNTIYEDRQGAVWIATAKSGLFRVRGAEVRRFTSRDGLPSDYSDDLSEGPAGEIWIGTDRGISRFAAGRFKNYGEAEGLPPWVEAVHVDRTGKVWAGTYGGAGLCELQGEKFSCRAERDGLPDHMIEALYEDRAGTLWIATRKGLARLGRDGAIASFGPREGLKRAWVESLREDRDGNIWIGTEAGLYRWNGREFAGLPAGDTLAGAPISHLTEDREGNLWFGTGFEGLQSLREAKVFPWGIPEGLSGKIALTVTEGAPGEVWIGTEGGLNLWKEGRITTYSRAQGLPDENVRALWFGRENGLWVGTDAGLCRFDGRSFRPFAANRDLPGQTIRALFEDRDGKLWIGMSGGIARWDGRRLTVWTRAHGLANEDVRVLHQDRAGTIWAGTDGGLHRLENGTWHLFSRAEGLKSDLIRALATDERGNLWAGMVGGGLHRFRDERFRAYTAAQGLPDETILQILPDGNGGLWLSSPKGIFRVAREDLDALDRGRIKRITPLVLAQAEGMRSPECSGGSQPAGWRDSAGRLWFPTIEGAVSIDPANLRWNRVPPPIALEEVTIDERPFDPKAFGIAPPGSARFLLRFAAMSFQAPEKVRFRYLLEGFDKSWIEAGAERQAAYTSLPAGTYRFRLRASNNDGVWNEKDAAWSFRVEPYFYQTAWFLLLCGAAVGAGAWGLYRLRLRQLRARYEAVLAERSRLAREVHDSLSQGLTAISLQLEGAVETLGEAPQEARQHMDVARGLVRRNLAEARRFVWDLRSEVLDRSGLSEALESVARQMTAGTPVEVTVTVRGRARRLPGPVESNLFRVGQEAITNAVRHADPRRIEVDLAFERHSVRLRVKDDGAGFDPFPKRDETDGGFGLVSMRERVAALKGKLRIHGQPGRGTEVLVEVPV